VAETKTKVVQRHVAAGLEPEDIEAIYRTAIRDCFSEAVA